MAGEIKQQHPYEGVDLLQLDEKFLSLLTIAAGPGRSAGEGLTNREKVLFRFGLLTARGEWELAYGAIRDGLDRGIVTVPDADRAMVEAVYVDGLPVSTHLGPKLSECGVRVPADVMEAAKAFRAGTPNAHLTEREIAALGLGLAWGARCWDT